MFQGAPPDSPWSERSRTVAIALVRYEQGLCPGCGKPIEDAWSPDATHAWVGEPITCGPCAGMDRAREARRKQGTGNVVLDDSGLHWVVHRRGETPLSAVLRAGRKEVP